MDMATEVDTQIRQLKRDIDSLMLPELEKQAGKEIVEEARKYYTPSRFPLFEFKERSRRLHMRILGNRDDTFITHDTSYYVSRATNTVFTTPQQVLTYIDSIEAM